MSCCTTCTRIASPLRWIAKSLLPPTTCTFTSNANVSYHDVVQVTGNVSGVLTITSSWAHGYTGNLDTANLFVDASNVTLTKFVYAGQESTDRWDSATISGETALSLSDRANAEDDGCICYSHDMDTTNI